MSELLPGTIKVESEFQHVPAPVNINLTAACGPNAAAAAARWADQDSSITTVSIYQRMRALPNPNGGIGLGSVAGASTQSDLVATLRSLGYQITLTAAGESLTSFAQRMLASGQAVVLEVSNGQAFTDYLTNAGEDATGLQFHYVCLVGRNPGGSTSRPLPPNRTSVPPGYWVADGDNNTQNPVIDGVRVHQALNGDLVYYADTTVAAAQPYSAFAVATRMRVEGQTMIPTGWTDNANGDPAQDAGVLTAPGGTTVLHGFRRYVLTHTEWDAANEPLEAEQAVEQVELSNPTHGAGHIQRFKFAQLSWTASEGVFLSSVGTEAKYLRTTLSTVTAQAQQAAAEATALQAKLDAANSQLVTLQAQIAALQQQIANAPKPDPLAAKALSIMAALKAMLGEL